jgi:hypothetical protein
MARRWKISWTELMLFKLMTRSHRVHQWATRVNLDLHRFSQSENEPDVILTGTTPLSRGMVVPTWTTSLKPTNVLTSLLLLLVQASSHKDKNSKMSLHNFEFVERPHMFNMCCQRQSLLQCRKHHAHGPVPFSTVFPAPYVDGKWVILGDTNGKPFD